MKSSYELVIIVSQSIPAHAISPYASGVSDYIREVGGQVVGVDMCGLRSLAYEIAKNRRGYYMIFKICLDSSNFEVVRDKFRFDTRIIRYLFIKVDEFLPNPLAVSRGTDDGAVNDNLIDYKNIGLLRLYLNKVSKILPRRTNKVSLKQQHRITQEISRARFLGLMSYGA